MEISYKDIPKELRRHYRQAVWRSLKRAIWAHFNFSKLYERRHEMFMRGVVEDNLHLSLDHLYWYCDNTERVDDDPSKPLSYVRCWYGDEGYQKTQGFDYDTASPGEKKRQSRKWLRRNNDWNNKARIGLKFAKGFEVIKDGCLGNTGFDADGELLPITLWRNEKYHGEQSVLLSLNGTNEIYFRFSYTVEISWYHPMRLFLGYRYVNHMRGVENRYLFKWRYFVRT